MSVAVIFSDSHRAAPSISPPQSEEKVRHAVMMANMEASMFWGMTYIILMVIGRTARLMKMDWLKSISIRLMVQSLMPQAKVHLTTFAYMKHVCRDCKIKERVMSFHAEYFIKKLINMMVPIKLPID